MKFENLRPPQQKAVELLRKDWNTYRTHVLYASVAFGKTAFAAYLARSFNEAGKRVLFIAPYTVLVEQTAERFNQYGLDDIGIIWRDHPSYNPQAKIQIASADTLIRRDWPDNIDLVIVDECHIRRAKLIELFKEISQPVIGLSGTPFANWMGSVYENLIKPTTMRELIDQGYLSDYEFYAPNHPSMAGAKTSNTAGFGQDFTEAAAFAAMDDIEVYGDIVQNWIDNGENRQTIAFCVNVAHANHLTLEFSKAGVSAEVVTAKTKTDERREIFKRFAEGVTKIICNVGVLVAGFDQDVRCIIYARPTKSEIRWIQCLGRTLREVDSIPQYYKRYIELRDRVSMYKVLFQVEQAEDLDRVKKVILANHVENGDRLVFSEKPEKADLTIKIPALEKRSALIFDHSGSVFSLGYPDSIEYESLINKSDGMTKQEKIKKEIEKIEKQPIKCLSCDYMKPAGSPPKCPRCGFTAVNGDDALTDRSVKLQKLKGQLEGPVSATQEEKQKFYSELKGYQRERRAKGKIIKDGWCAHNYRERFGVWPRGINQNAVRPVSLETRNWLQAQFIKYRKGRK